MSLLLDAKHTEHRPWPLPRRPWVLRMTWHELVFLHWPIDPALLRPHVPEGLAIDTFDGSAWLGVVPFRMSGVRPRFVPALPGVSAFPELNLRTYVTAQDKAGVWFFSLDVTKPVAVLLARSLFHLPYFRARMAMEREDRTIRYASARTQQGTEVEFAGEYRACGSVFRSVPGTIEAWLTERYCLYSADRRGRIFRGEIQHAPWPLQQAEFEIERNTLAGPIGMELSSRPPLAHYSDRLEVVAWALCPVALES
jgi:hypothetical protein